jgi:hypothetical protein
MIEDRECLELRFVGIEKLAEVASFIADLKAYSL